MVKMYAGDSRNCLENVRREMRRIKYPKAVDYAALLRGQQSCFIDVYRYLFCEFSPILTKYLSDKGFDLTGMSDKKFMESVYRCIRDMLIFKPSITLTQFFSSGFAERKMDMLVLVCQGILSQRDVIAKPVVQKSVHTRSILETLNNRRSKDKEPEIIEISPPRMREKDPKPAKRSRVRVVASSDSKRNSDDVSRDERNSTYIDSMMNHDGERRILLDEMVSLPSYDPQMDAETQTYHMSNAKLLEDISTKLDNIVARITILESRMSVIEGRLPADVISHDYQQKDLPFSSPPVTMGPNRNERFTERMVSDTTPAQQRRPVEAVVINQTNQSQPAVKLMRFYGGDGESCSNRSNDNSTEAKGNKNCPGQYSPSLYRLDSQEHVRNQNGVSDEDASDNSDVTSEESHASNQQSNASNKRLSPDDNHDGQEYPVKLSDTLQANDDALQSQVTRIQEMINSTNLMLSNFE